MGAQNFTSRTLNDTLNPKWNFNCQFNIRDLYQDVLCITIFERDQFSPDGQSLLSHLHLLIFSVKSCTEDGGFKCCCWSVKQSGLSSTTRTPPDLLTCSPLLLSLLAVFLGRTEVPVATIKKELENKGAVTRRLLLHEVPTGEVWVRLDLQLFGGK